MDDVTRWTLGLLFTLIIGAYAYTYAVSYSASAADVSLENRITRQLDIIERKIDRVLERQYIDRK